SSSKNSAIVTNKVGPANNKKDKLKVDILVDDDPAKLEKQVKALQLILKNEKDRGKKINLYLRLSYLHVSIAKKYSVKRIAGEKISIAEKRHLDEADKIIAFLLKNIENNNKALSTLYNIKGLVSYELDKVSETVENFLKSIELNPSNNQAEVMALFVGEYYFDQEKYEEAIKYYQLFYKRMNLNQKSLSDYKVAWSYLNLKELDKAEHQFMKVIKENLDSGTTEDAYKDLAFILTQNQDEVGLITKVNLFTNSNEIKSKLYYFCLLFYLQSSKDKTRESLFKEVLHLQKDYYEQLKILALKVSFEKRDIPTLGMNQALEKVDAKLNSAKSDIREKFLKNDSKLLEDESEYNIRTHIDAYSGKLKTEQNLSKKQISDVLIKLIGTHLRWFPESKKKNILYNLWIDTCVDIKNTVCLFDLENNFKKDLKNSDAKEYLRKLQIELLAMYDQAYELDKVKHHASFVARLKQYIDLFPNDPISAKSRKRLFGVYFSVKNYKEALPLIEEVYKAEANAENAQKLLLCLFELGEYDKILADNVYTKYDNSEILDIKREASLKSAMQNADKGNFDKYENDIKIYLSTNPSEEKSKVIYVDYFKKLLELQFYDKFKLEWEKLATGFKTKPEFNGVKGLFFDKTLNDGNFLKMESLWSYGSDKGLNEKIFINKLVHNVSLVDPDFQVLSAMSSEKKMYILTVLNYFNPDMVYTYLKAIPSPTKEEKRMQLTSLLLKSNLSEAQFDEQEIKSIKEIVPENYLKDSEIKVEKELRNVVFPSKKMKPKVYESYVVNNVDNIKYLRVRVLKSLKTALPVQKIRVLKNMSDIELKMAQSIKDSPVPEGLSEAQLKEYQTGLETMAADYEKQSQDFLAAKQELENALLKQKEDEKNKIFPIVSEEKWSVAQSDSYVKIKDIYNKVSAKAALVFLDNIRASKKITVEEYYNMKIWILLKTKPSETLRKLIFEELIAANQAVMIEKWKGLSK
ncbi:MAG: hypothetical protein L6Q37_08135, partial [Bdellovibrionaceae bacterium]|nr:hypothetical protein [Pseudobdellovibrionaceae bacterium]